MSASIGKYSSTYKGGEYLSFEHNGVAWHFKINTDEMHGYDYRSFHDDMPIKICRYVKVTVTNYITKAKSSGVLSYYGSDFMQFNDKDYDISLPEFFPTAEDSYDIRISPFDHMIFSILGYGDITMEPIGEMPDALKLKYCKFNGKLALYWKKGGLTHVAPMKGKYMGVECQEIEHVDVIHENGVTLKYFTVAYEPEEMHFDTCKMKSNVLDQIKEENDSVNYIYDAY